MMETIRDYVRRRLSLNSVTTKELGGDATLEQIWRDARDAFPHRAPGWGNIGKLKREFDKENGRD